MSPSLRGLKGESNWAEPHKSCVCGSCGLKNTITAKLWPSRQSWSGGTKRGLTSLSLSLPLAKPSPSATVCRGQASGQRQTEKSMDVEGIDEIFLLKYSLKKMWPDYYETDMTLGLNWKCDSVKPGSYWLPITQKAHMTQSITEQLRLEPEMNQHI